MQINDCYFYFYNYEIARTYFFFLSFFGIQVITVEEMYKPENINREIKKKTFLNKLGALSVHFSQR